jgi:hypothetical protein
MTISSLKQGNPTTKHTNGPIPSIGHTAIPAVNQLMSLSPIELHKMKAVLSGE